MIQAKSLAVQPPPPVKHPPTPSFLNSCMGYLDELGTIQVLLWLPGVFLGSVSFPGEEVLDLRMKDQIRLDYKVWIGQNVSLEC